MNEAPPVRRRRAFTRTAAATATAVGAALLTTPGIATAQDDVDCADLGDDPLAYNIGEALESAVACGVEVRLFHEAWPYSTVYATPQGQLHLVATADAVQQDNDDLASDPTLTEWGDYLSQTWTPWPYYLGYADPAAPLVTASDDLLHWDGDLPRPTYSGTTAVYEELAAGLDFTVRVDDSSIGLRFEAATAEAWDELASGLAVGDPATASIVDGRLEFDSSYRDFAHGTTPFAARDADETITPVAPSLDAEGNLSLALPSGALETAAFPLELIFQWGDYRDFTVSEWGAVTSAYPDLALYRGEGGLDAPYFTAAGEAGSALAGSYCDGIADPDCSEPATAAAYWEFGWPNLHHIGKHPSRNTDFHFPVASAVFQVDASEGAACTAPDLMLTEAYSIAATWSDRPAELGAAGTGSCQDGTASYDVTDALADEWAEPETDETVTFGMTGGPETARFDGDSARLDVYLDFTGFRYIAPDREDCGYSDASPVTSRGTVRYGSFYVTTWNDDPVDHDLTWTASFEDASTGENVLTTGPQDLVADSDQSGSVRQPRFLLEPGVLPDGTYEVVHTITSGNGAFEYRASPCHLYVDTVEPEILDFEVAAGPHLVGDTVDIRVTVADEGFPGEAARLVLQCDLSYPSEDPDPVILTEGSTATCRVPLEKTATRVSLDLRDRAGNRDSASVTVNASHLQYDYSGDGATDLVAQRTSDGTAYLYSGSGEGRFTGGVSLGGDLAGMDLVETSGDFDADGYQDLIARSDADGRLWLVPGDAPGSLGAPELIGTGWNTMSAIVSGHDYNGDGRIDVVAREKSTGNLWLYLGDGDGTIGSRMLIGTGWSSLSLITAVGDLDHDAAADVLARKADDCLYLYAGKPAGGLYNGVKLGCGWQVMDTIAAVGDFDGDGHLDWVARYKSTGKLYLYRGDGDGSHAPPIVVGTGWNGMSIIA
jgi:hypothetical protein